MPIPLSIFPSKEPSQQRVKKWGFSLEDALKDPAGQELFLKFLESEFSSENLRWAKYISVIVSTVVYWHDIFTALFNRAVINSINEEKQVVHKQRFCGEFLKPAYSAL